MRHAVLLGAMLALCAGAAELPDIITEFAYRDDLPAVAHPVLSSWASGSPAQLRRQTADILALSEAELLPVLPRRNGIFFAGCPVPGCRNPQGSRFAWSLRDPGRITCGTCQTVFPHPDYPEHGSVTVTAPSGKTLAFPYVLGADGRKHYLQAAIDSRKVQFFSAQAGVLAQLYLKTGDLAAGRRAALIICALARAFPDFVYKYDYPFTEVEWVNGQPPPGKLRPHFRTSRLDWWAYMDMPTALILAYDFLQRDGLLAAVAAEQQLRVHEDIVQGFYRTACEGILANPDPLTNMSPTAWRSLMLAARVFAAPDYFHVCLRRLGDFQRRFFLYDGFWMEPSPGYHRQTVGGLQIMEKVIDGYSDPEGPLSRYALERLTRADASQFLPLLELGRQRSQQLVYPDGRNLPLNDTWGKEIVARGDTTRPSCLIPALGLALLSRGTGLDQTQLGLAFTLKTGHNHYDVLNLTLYANRREMLSDAGYTHTHLRGYASSSAAHNLVVVDGKSQTLSRLNGPVDFVELNHPELGIAAADGPRAYPELRDFRRALFHVPLDGGGTYAADFFAVEGEAATLDYFLHGDLWREKSEIVRVGERTLSGQPGDLLDAAQRAAWTPASGGTVWEDIRQPFRSYGYFQQMRRFNGADVADTLRVTWSDDLDIWLPPPAPGTVLWTGRSPAIAPANEDADAIQRLMARFLCLRATPPPGGGRVVFSAVMAPAPTPEAAADRVVAVQRPGDGILHVRLASGREDLIWWRQSVPVRVNLRGQPVTVSGLYGFYSLHPDGSRRASYLIQEKIALPVSAADGRTSLKFAGASQTLPPRERLADFVRILHPETQTAFGNHIGTLDVAGGRLETREPLGFSLGHDGLFRHTGFPLTELAPGTVVEFFVLGSGIQQQP